MTGNYINKLFAQWYIRIFALLIILALAIVNAYNFGTDISLVLLICLMAGSMLIEKLRVSNRWDSFGIGINSFTLKEFFWGILFGLIPILLTLFIIYLSDVKITKTDYAFEQHLSFIYFLLVLVLIEEFIFRGIIFQAILERFGKIQAVIVFCILFVIAHLFNPNINLIAIINIFIASLLLSIMYIQTRSLWLPIAFHFSWNFFQASLLNSKISGLIPSATLLKIEYEAMPKILFGGEFGLEAGLLTTIYLLVSTIVIMKYFTPSPVISAVVFKRKYLESKLLAE